MRIEETSPAWRDGSAAPVAAGSIARPAIRGSLWTMGGYAAGQVLRLGSNLVLTRLLFPAVFGQMALVFIFIQGLQMFSDVGTGPAIIQSPRGDDESFLNTAWTIQAARGVALWIASWALAWPVAAFYGQPPLRWLIPAAGLTALLAGFESTAMHAQQRHLRLGRLTLVELAGQATGIAVTLALAFLDRTLYGPDHPAAVWAIVAGSVAAGAARVVLSHGWLPGVRNRFHLDPATARALFRFGRWIFVSTLLTFLAAQSDRLVFGKVIPLPLLGVYSIAAMLAALPTNAVLKLGAAVVFPAYSRLVGRDDFGALFQRVRLPLLLGGAAVVAVLLAGGPLLVRILYDRRYAEAGAILQYLAAGAWFQILECTNGAALLAQGHVKWVAAASATKVAGMVVLIPLGFHLAGFEGALAGLVLSDALKYLTSAVAAAVSGLRGFGRDLVLTLAIAAVALLFAAGRARAATPGCGDEPLRRGGKVAYFCDCAPGAAAGCVPGDDASPGTSPGKPRRSLAAAFDRFREMDGGDTVALCRGGAWTGSRGSLRNPRCGAASPCDFRDYRPAWAGPDAARPRLQVGPEGAFALDSPGPHHGGYRFWNLDVRGPDPGKGDTFMLYEDVTDVDICDVRMEGAYVGVNVQPRGTADTHVVIRDSQFHGYGFSAIYGGTHGLTIDSNRFVDNGLLGRMFDHTIYLGPGGAPPPYTGQRIVNNEIRTDARCGGVMIVLHGRQRGVTIENNLVVNEGAGPHCYAIQTGGSVVYGLMQEVAIRRNRVLFGSGGGSTAIEASACEGCAVTDNVIRAAGNGIAVGTSSGGTNGPTRDVLVQNNSVFLTGSGTGIVVGPGAGGDGLVVENNAVFTEGACFSFGSATPRAGHNYCRTAGGPAAGAVWLDAPGGDFRPVRPGPLAGAADQARYSQTAMGLPSWSPADAGVKRAPPVDIGAFAR